MLTLPMWLPCDVDELACLQRGKSYCAGTKTVAQLLLVWFSSITPGLTPSCTATFWQASKIAAVRCHCCNIDACATLQMIKPVEHGMFDILHLLLVTTVHPACRLRVQWDSFVLVVLGSVCLFTPFVICFDIDYRQLSFIGAFLFIQHPHCIAFGRV